MTTLSEDKTKHALEVAAGVLEAIRPYCLVDLSTKYTIQCGGRRVGSFTVDEALDVADAALGRETEVRL